MLYISIEGGVVQSNVTRSASLVGQSVTVIDYDTEGADASDLGCVTFPAGETVPAFIGEREVGYDEFTLTESASTCAD